MRKLLITIALLLSIAVCDANAIDLRERDKQLHMGVSSVFGLVTGSTIDNKWAAFSIAMIPGLFKELSDETMPNNKFDIEDMAANAIGAAVGVTIGHEIGLLIYEDRFLIRWEF